MNKALQDFQVDGSNGNYIELTNPMTNETILGVIVKRSSTTWFFKLRGDIKLAEQEKDRFKQFVRSVKFKAS